MVRVVTQGRLRVYVYAKKGGRHNAPHCHVEWGDGACVIELGALLVLRGDANRRAIELVRDNEGQIWTAWNRLNEQGV